MESDKQRVKLKRIIQSIDDLFSDTSVSQDQTLEWMEEIRDEAQAKADCLIEDIKNKTNLE